MSDQPRETFELVLTDCGGPGSVPVIHRLRSCLKSMKRAYGLRCVKARRLPPDATPGPSTTNGVDDGNSDT